MTKAEILNDLDYVKTLAEEGRNAPLLGGRFGVMWGVLLAAAFTVHWFIASGNAGLSPQWLSALWLVFALTGVTGCVILGKSQSSRPGAASAGNRAEHGIWASFSIMMVICFAGIFTNVMLNQGGQLSLDLMLVLGWAGQGMAYLAVSRLSGDARLKLPAALALLTAFIVLTLYGHLGIYLISAASAVLTLVLPGLAQIRREPSHVV